MVAITAGSYDGFLRHGCPCGLSAGLPAQAVREEADRGRVAVLDAYVGGVEQLEGVPDAQGAELGGKRDRAEVEVVLVPLAGVDPDAPHGAERVRMLRGHPDRVEIEPPLPDVVAQPPRGGVERQDHRAVRLGRVAGGHAPGVEDLVVVLDAERRAERKSAQKRSYEPS